MPPKRKRSELNHKTNKQTAPRTRPSVPPQKCRNTTNAIDKEDPYDRLTDDIIACNILSRLCLREAIRTSVLSRRWRNLWIDSIGSKLIFAYPAKHYFRRPWFEVRPFLEHGIRRILEYVKPTFDELTIHLNFNSANCHQAVDRWVQLALKNKVTRLHLDFSSYDDSYNMILEQNYTFPAIHAAHPGIHNLRDVCFKYMNVSKEVIECMVSNCPSLERLAVWGSSIQQKVRVYTQSTKLMSLEFVDCEYKEIKISAPNLIHLRYNDSKDTKIYLLFFPGSLRLDYVPLLSELSIGSSLSKSFLSKNARFLAKYDISQLKKLKLDIRYYIIEYEFLNDLLKFSKLINLEQLEVELEPDFRMPSHSHLWLIRLIKAAPSLQKFSINLNKQKITQKEPRDGSDNKDEYLLKNIVRLSHPTLKLIEMINFSGSSSEMKLGQHLICTSPLLEKFVVRRLCDAGTRRNRRPRALYKKQARKFNEWLPPNAKLVIL